MDNGEPNESFENYIEELNRYTKAIGKVGDNIIEETIFPMQMPVNVAIFDSAEEQMMKGLEINLVLEIIEGVEKSRRFYLDNYQDATEEFEEAANEFIAACEDVIRLVESILSPSIDMLERLIGEYGMYAESYVWGGDSEPIVLIELLEKLNKEKKSAIEYYVLLAEICSGKCDQHLDSLLGLNFKIKKN